MLTNFIIVLFWLNIFTIADTPSQEWNLAPESTITILGQSNVNQFQCQTTLEKNSNAWEYIRVGIKKNTQKITLPVRQFDCGNKIMNRDFREALHEETYPKISINIKSLAPIPRNAEKEAKIKGKVEIELAGTCRNFEVPFKLTQNKQNEIHLTGKYMVAFSDFQLQPPTKFWGMVEVRDEIQVALHLIFKN